MENEQILQHGLNALRESVEGFKRLKARIRIISTCGMCLGRGGVLKNPMISGPAKEEDFFSCPNCKGSGETSGMFRFYYNTQAEPISSKKSK